MKYGIIATKENDRIVVNVYNKNFIKVACGQCIDENSIMMCAAYAIVENREYTLRVEYCGVTKQDSETVLFWKHNFHTYSECKIRIMEVIEKD